MTKIAHPLHQGGFTLDELEVVNTERDGHDRDLPIEIDDQFEEALSVEV